VGRVAEPGVEPVAVDIVVSHRRLRRTSSVPSHRSGAKVIKLFVRNFRIFIIS
jgi:hypothetical protein